MSESSLYSALMTSYKRSCKTFNDANQASTITHRYNRSPSDDEIRRYDKSWQNRRFRRSAGFSSSFYFDPAFVLHPGDFRIGGFPISHHTEIAPHPCRWYEHVMNTRGPMCGKHDDDRSPGEKKKLKKSSQGVERKRAERRSSEKQI